MSSISVLEAPGAAQGAAVKPSSVGSAPVAPSPTVTTTTAANSAPLFHSPQLEIDPLLNQVIVEFRDGQSGAPEYQVPSKSQLLLYQDTQTAAVAPVSPGSSKAI
jgi:hypothetical protein